MTRREFQDKLAELATRIFTLRKTQYRRHELEKSIGYLLWRLNDYDTKLDATEICTLEAVYEDLCEAIEGVYR